LIASEAARYPLIEKFRWGAGNTERYRAYGAELVALAPDVILVSSGSALAALQPAPCRSSL
jgi:hypothetical protein